MSRDQSLKVGATSAEQSESAVDTANPALDFRGPWFNSATAAAYLQISNADAFRKWAKRHSIVFLYRGRRVLVAKADLDRAIGAARPSLRRVSA